MSLVRTVRAPYLAVNPAHSVLSLSGQLFSRPEHVLRHRARNICIAGLDRPGEPKRKAAGVNASKAKLPTSPDDSSGELADPMNIVTPVNDGPASSISRRAAAGSRIANESDPSTKLKTTDASTPRYQCEWCIYLALHRSCMCG